jgi:hypothetical protein
LRVMVAAIAALIGLPVVSVALAAPAGAISGLSVTDMNKGVSSSDLANALVGSGVTVSNVTYTGDNRAAGTFTGGSGIVGFNSGIVLDSGKVQTYPSDPTCSQGVEGPNTCYENGGPLGNSNSTSFGLPGDSDLTTLAGVPTYDASVLQFDFVPTYSTVQFSYVFSSEEYSDFSNTGFNDTFGFFVNGTNCALVPGTTDPVSVNTINNGNDNGGDTTPHNAQYFINNVPPTLNTQMDGLTTVLTCDATVNPGTTNHMKLAIADGSDSILDSAVFLEGQSLVSGTAISTSLSGGGQTGASISVPQSTSVADQATLTGVNASTATGKVTYSLYSNAACSNLVAGGTPQSITTPGTLPPSAPVTLTNPGTYYWKAIYSGDGTHNGSNSTCGANGEVETVTSTSGGKQPKLDTIATGYHAYAAGSVSTSHVSTTGGGELLVALVQADGAATATQTVKSVTGAGLTWTRASWADLTGAGSSEVWQAYAPTKLTNATVQASFAQPADGLISVESFTGAAHQLGAVGIGSKPGGPAKATVTPASSNSLVIAGGLDWSTATKPIPVAGQSLVTTFIDSTVGDWYWTQSVAAPTTAGTPVTVQAGLPANDRWSLVAVEIPPAS